MIEWNSIRNLWIKVFVNSASTHHKKTLLITASIADYSMLYFTPVAIAYQGKRHIFPLFLVKESQKQGLCSTKCALPANSRLMRGILANSSLALINRPALALFAYARAFPLLPSVLTPVSFQLLLIRALVRFYWFLANESLIFRKYGPFKACVKYQICRSAKLFGRNLRDANFTITVVLCAYVETCGWDYQDTILFTAQSLPNLYSKGSLVGQTERFNTPNFGQLESHEIRT